MKSFGSFHLLKILTEIRPTAVQLPVSALAGQIPKQMHLPGLGTRASTASEEGRGERFQREEALIAQAPAVRGAEPEAFLRAHLIALQASQIHHVIAAFGNKAH